MSDGSLILALGTTPGSPEQRAALVRLVKEHRPAATEAMANACANRILKEHGQFRTIPKIIQQFCD